MKDWHGSFARRIGVSGIDFTPAGVGQTLHVPCSHGHLADVRVEKRMPQEAVVKKMLRAGWTLGHKLTCPEHSRKPKANGVCGTEAPPKPEDAVVVAKRQPLAPFTKDDPRIRQNRTEPATAQRIVEALFQASSLSVSELTSRLGTRPTTVPRALESLLRQKTVIRSGSRCSYRYSLAQPAKQKEDPMPEAATKPTEPSEAARTARRLAHMLLEEKFDVPTGNYREGYSDQKVADETGAGLQFVTRRREEEFGPLKTPSEFAEIEGKMRAFERQIEEANAQAVRDNDTHNKNVAQLREGLATLRREITVVMRKNGWA